MSYRWVGDEEAEAILCVIDKWWVGEVKVVITLCAIVRWWMVGSEGSIDDKSGSGP